MATARTEPVLEGYFTISNSDTEEMRAAAQLYRNRISPEFLRHYVEMLVDECIEHAEVIDFVLTDGPCSAVAFWEDKRRGRYIVAFKEDGSVECYFDGEEEPSRSSSKYHMHVANNVFRDEIGKLV